MDKTRLNPCFNGRYSQSVRDIVSDDCDLVLILVLMEDTLRELFLNTYNNSTIVLILVLMEDTLRALADYNEANDVVVLILVLMEDTLRVPVILAVHLLLHLS